MVCAQKTICRFSHGRYRDRTREKETLQIAAASRGKEISLPHRFHAFCCRSKAQAMTEGDHRGHNGSSISPCSQKCDEGSIDLDPVDTELNEVAQRGIARSEVVQSNPYAVAPQGA